MSLHFLSSDPTPTAKPEDMETNDLVLLNFWASPFGMRVRIALAEKRVNYEYREEDLKNKSDLLLKMNPVHKRIPVLIHNGRPVHESLNIVQYIDAVFNQIRPLLPSDPYQRAHACFWAHFIDNKVHATGIRVWTTKGKEQEKAMEEFTEHFKVLEHELADKPYFGGDTFGFVDIALIPFYGWFNIDESCPKIVAWAHRCKERESVAKSAPDREKVYEHMLEIKKKLALSDI